MPIERVPLGDDRGAWLAARLGFINASEMPTVCGEAHFGSLAELFAEKKGLRPPRIDSAVLRRGRWGEASVFEALADERPEWKIVRAKVHVRDTARRIACTPDGFAEAPGRDGIGVVQTKVIARSIFRQRWLDNPLEPFDGAATPPVPYRIQTLTEEMLNSTSWGVLAVLICGEFDWQLRLFDIDRDPVIEDRILYCSEQFWRNHLDLNIMPPFEPQRDAALVKALYPRDNGEIIDLTKDNRALVLAADLDQTRAALKRLHDQEDALKTELEAKLGEATFGLLADGRCLSWRHQHRKAFTVPATDFRVLRLLKSAPVNKQESDDDS